jgi:hypothetical protein
MTDQEIRTLLAAAMAYDNRKAGDANVLAWSEVADRARWDFDDALDAVHAHYAQSTEFLMPAHITAWVRSIRQQRHEREVAARMAAPAALPAAGYRMSPALQAVHDEANVRACSRCHQPAGQRCVEPGTTVRTRIPHLCRMTGRDDAEIGRRVPSA